MGEMIGRDGPVASWRHHGHFTKNLEVPIAIIVDQAKELLRFHPPLFHRFHAKNSWGPNPLFSLIVRLFAANY